MKECPFKLSSRCDIWIDYQVTCEALREAEEQYSFNQKEIRYLLERVKCLESVLIKAGMKIPE